MAHNSIIPVEDIADKRRTALPIMARVGTNGIKGVWGLKRKVTGLSLACNCTLIYAYNRWKLCLIDIKEPVFHK